MKLPTMRCSDGIRKHKQLKFDGLNHTLGAEDGALWDMKNLSSDDYPLLSVRPNRKLLGTLAKPNGLFYWKGMMWVDGTDVYFDGKVVGQVEDSRKTFGAIGPYIVILPDKVCYHVGSGEWKPMEQIWKYNGNEMNCRISSANVSYFDAQDAAGNTNTYSAITVQMRALAQSDDAENTAPDFESIFRVGETVTIRGITHTEETEDGNLVTVTEEISLTIKGFSRRLYPYLDLYSCESQIIFDEGALSGKRGLGENLSISRDVPDLKYLCEDGNRLWGCDGDTIYASRLGDPLSWNTFDGLQTDSWALTPASSGEFTGCINYQGYPTFFKEDRLYKVYGELPSTFSVVDSPCLGVAKGCSDTLALAWGYVFYLGTNGPMIYSGSLPRPVSHAFGNLRFTGGCAGSDGLKYYGSLQSVDGQSRVYVYDVQRGLWHIEDDLEAVSFCRVDGDVYCLGADGRIRILGASKSSPEGSEEEAAFQWMAEFADFTQGEPNHKGVSKLQVRLGLEKGSSVTVFIQFDSDGVWRTVRTLTGDGSKRSFYLPIVPRRCDHYRLKLEGTGRARIYSLVQESYTGSERPAT